MNYNAGNIIFLFIYFNVFLCTIPFFLDSVYLFFSCRTIESSLPSRDKSKKNRTTEKSLETASWIADGKKALTQRAGEFLRNVEQDLAALAKEYSSLLEEFISQLPLQQHVDLKFLLFRLDFTEFYSQLRPHV